MSMRKMVVVFSGGMDSTICLYWAKDIVGKDNIYPIAFWYGQKHSIEVSCTNKILALAGIPRENQCFIHITMLGDSALLHHEQDISEINPKTNLPASYTPGRNILFLTYAAQYAYQVNTPEIVTGVCQTDFSGYPDCRESFITKMQSSLREGMDYPFTIHTPLMHIDKHQELLMGKKYPGCFSALAYSHTCYNGQVPPCGECPACILRAKAFYQLGETDPLIERLSK